MSKTKKPLAKKKNHKFLKKLGRAVYRFIEAIYKIIDKIIITPISKLMIMIMKLFRTNNKPFDRLLNNKIFLIVFSLILAFTAFVIVDKNADIMLNKSADVLTNQELKALYNEEAYVVEGLPDKVDITLIGRRADLYLAKQYPNDEVIVDLRDLRAGTHEVALKYNGTVSSVEYKLTPSTVAVVIYEKLTEARTITAEILNEQKMDTRYNVSNISFSRNEVYIKGADYKLEQVAIVKALVDVSKIVNPSVGTTTLKDIPLVAYDSNGEKVDVEIVPKTVDATLDITSPSKEVPLRVVPEGNVVFGKSIDSITLSETKVSIYGDSESLDKITSIPVKINVNDLNKNTEFNVNLSKPSGVKEMSISSVVVKVTLDSITEKKVTGVSIETKNLDNGLVAQAASKEDSSIDVIVKGTENNLKNITADNIKAVVDLQGLSSGTHEIEVTVTGDDVKLSYTPQKTKVKIIIRKQ